MQRFRKIPVEIEAIQFTRETARECLKQCPRLYYAITFKGNRDKTATIHFVNKVNDLGIPANAQFVIQTLEGNMNVSEGDWIIKGVNGEFYPCKPDIFAMTYEPVE